MEWFVQTQLSLSQGKEVVECYLKNIPSLEFLLVMMIYYVRHFPEYSHEMWRFTESVGLLIEAKCFLHNENIRVYFRAYFNEFNELEHFDDFMNRVEDMALRLDS